MSGRYVCGCEGTCTILLLPCASIQWRTHMDEISNAVRCSFSTMRTEVLVR